MTDPMRRTLEQSLARLYTAADLRRVAEAVQAKSAACIFNAEHLNDAWVTVRELDLDALIQEVVK